MVPLLSRDRLIGAFAWVRHAGRPRFDDRDLALAEEVARRASVAVENAQLYREAQRANQLKDEFVATLSHELRTPLNALLGWTELLRSGQLPPDRQHLALEAIERTARMQAQITNDLVDVSQAAAGAFRLAPRPVAAGEVIRNAAEAFRLAADAKGVRLGVHVAPEMPPVLVDPDRLQQIVFNLVGNAVKFTPAGTVDVRAGVQGGRLEVDVCDTGIGIPASFLPFVFDRFRQADGSTSRQYGGLGLGLSIVRSLVELHGGRVVAAQRGRGARRHLLGMDSGRRAGRHRDAVGRRRGLTLTAAPAVPIPPRRHRRRGSPGPDRRRWPGRRRGSAPARRASPRSSARRAPDAVRST